MKALILAILLLPTLLLAAPKTITLSESSHINFNQPFSAMFVAKKQVEAIQKCAAKPGSDIYIVMYTPGGSITAGNLFKDTLSALPCKFHTITIFSASMGYQTVQALGNRYILPSGTLMSHRASIRGLSGEVGGELDSVLRNIYSEVDAMESRAAKRVGITLEQYKNQISDELWLTASESVKSNHADSEVVVLCDSTLQGTFVDEVATIFGAFDVEFSNCPIVTAPLRVLRYNGNRRLEAQMTKKLIDQYSNIKDYVEHYKYQFNVK